MTTLLWKHRNDVIACLVLQGLLLLIGAAVHAVLLSQPLPSDSGRHGLVLPRSGQAMPTP